METARLLSFGRRGVSGDLPTTGGSEHQDFREPFSEKKKEKEENHASVCTREWIHLLSPGRRCSGIKKTTVGEVGISW